MQFWYSLSPNLPADLTAKAKVIFDDLVDEDIVVWHEMQNYIARVLLYGQPRNVLMIYILYLRA